MEEFLGVFRNEASLLLRNKKNIINTLLLGILILGLPLGVNVLRRQQIIKSRATVDPIVFTGANVEQRNGTWVALKPQISLQLTSPLGHATTSAAPTLTLRKIKSEDQIMSFLFRRLTGTVYAAEATWYGCSEWTSEQIPNTPEDRGCKNNNPDSVAWRFVCTACNTRGSGSCGDKCDPNGSGRLNAPCSWTSCQPTAPQSSGPCTADHQSPDLGAACTTCIANSRPALTSIIRGFNHDVFDNCSAQQIVNFWCNGGVSPEAVNQCRSDVEGTCSRSCRGSASAPSASPSAPPPLAVPPVTTNSFRIAESASDLNSKEWQAYTADGMTVDFEFTDTTAGVKNVFVQFKDSNGKKGGCGDNQSQPCRKQIALLGPGPIIASCALGFEGNNTVLNLTGQNFGSGRGTVKSGETSLQIREWKDTGVKAVWSNAPTGQLLPVVLTNSNGQTGEGQCGAISQLALGAKVFCRAPSSHQTDNVDLTLAGEYEGGTRIRQKVSIDKDGLIQGLTQKLEGGKNYRLSLKAPKALRRATSFTAGDGVTNIPNFVLPVGDIFPADGGDGAINALDKAELNRQFIISQDSCSRSGDFNKDCRVNSIDWACMRYDFGVPEDSEPLPGSLPIPALSPSPISSPSATPVFSPSPASSPSATPALIPSPSPSEV